MYRHLQVELSGAQARVVIHRPERRNAIDSVLMGELSRLVQELEQSPGIRCVAFSGDASGVFLSGGDLKEVRALRQHEEALEYHRKMAGILRRLELLDAAVIFAIGGLTIGGGCEVVLAGDRRVMARSARLNFRQVVLGLPCGWGGISRLIRLVGRSRAFQILLMEGEISADRALEFGLVDEVVDDALLQARVTELMAQLVGLPPLALRSVKRALVRCEEQPFERAVDYEGELFARAWASEDHWEALEAFQAGRQGTYQGR